LELTVCDTYRLGARDLVPGRTTSEGQLKGSVYVNHVAADDLPEKVRASFGDNYRRLRELKAKFDPTNLFRVNANIPPG
jgi:FAD/FMN-containing dehydrogenase